MTERGRLLFVAPWFLLPRKSGGRIRTTDVLRGMKDRRFEITLASPRPVDGRDWSAEITGCCDRFAGWTDDTRRSTVARVRNLASRLPVSVALDRSATASRVIAEELARGPDVVVFDFVHTAVLAPERFDAPSVVFTHNVESEIYRRHADVAKDPLRRAIWRNQHAKMERFERAALARFDTVVAVSERDRATFESSFGLRDVRVIPTGVDVEFYGPRPAPHAGDAARGGTVVFTGSMDWLPNIDGMRWFLDEIWPRIAERAPGAAVVVVGRDPDPDLVAEVERRRVPWTFTGFVDDVRPFVHDADVYVIPLRTGGGTRLKAYEAMAMQCPVVSTALGVEGLPVVPDEHYVRADRPREFANAVLDLLGDAGARARLGAASRDFVVDHCSSGMVARRFEEICADTARGVVD